MRKFQDGDMVEVAEDARRVYASGGLTGPVSSLLRGRQAKVSGYSSRSNEYFVEVEGYSGWVIGDYLTAVPTFRVGDIVDVAEDALYWGSASCMQGRRGKVTVVDGDLYLIRDLDSTSNFRGWVDAKDLSLVEEERMLTFSFSVGEDEVITNRTLGSLKSTPRDMMREEIRMAVNSVLESKNLPTL